MTLGVKIITETCQTNLLDFFNLDSISFFVIKFLLKLKYISLINSIQ